MDDQILENMSELSLARAGFGIQILRSDNPNGEPKLIQLSPGMELEEAIEKIFAAAYPGNGTAPPATRIKSIDGNEIDDVTILQVLPQGKVIVDPGLNFVDQKAVEDIIHKQEADRKKDKEIKKAKRNTKFNIGNIFPGKKEQKTSQQKIFSVKAEVIKSYAAEHEDEIDIEKGEIILLDTSTMAEEGWLFAQKKSKIGLIPVSHVKIYHAGDGLPSLSSDSQIEVNEESNKDARILIKATCLHNFQGENEDELAVLKGDVIMVDVEHVSKGEQWIYGEKEGKVGYIPSSYIKVGVIDVSTLDKRDRIWVYAEAVYNYEAQKEDELSLRDSDILMVDDNQDHPDWRYAQMNGREGWIPSGYVKIISKDEVKKKAKMKMADLRQQKKILEEEIRKKKIKDAQALRLKKIREAELEKRRKEAEEKRKKEEMETKRAEMVRKAMWSRGKLLGQTSDDEKDDY